ncbi:hypothetical protein [Embleya sp. NPDC020630]|uniref:hypothetical protein n=1 Tax=Embleya sp. NPDC020630 TaxID=3363979 RepID=UPI0037931E52
MMFAGGTSSRVGGESHQRGGHECRRVVGRGSGIHVRAEAFTARGKFDLGG